jgi:hypothetical protein
MAVRYAEKSARHTSITRPGPAAATAAAAAGLDGQGQPTIGYHDRKLCMCLYAPYVGG